MLRQNARMIRYSLSSLLKVILIIFKAPVIYFAFAVFIDYAVLYLTVILMYKYKNYTVSGWYIDIFYIKYILKSAVPLFAAVFFYTFYQKITVIFISSMYSDYASGIYSAAARLTEIWYMVPAVLMTAFFPAIVKAKQISEEETNKHSFLCYNNSFDFNGIICCIIISIYYKNPLWRKIYSV